MENAAPAAPSRSGRRGGPNAHFFPAALTRPLPLLRLLPARDEGKSVPPTASAPGEPIAPVLRPGLLPRLIS